jgi:hypothetical protein
MPYDPSPVSKRFDRLQPRRSIVAVCADGVLLSPVVEALISVNPLAKEFDKISELRLDFDGSQHLDNRKYAETEIRW